MRLNSCITLCLVCVFAVSYDNKTTALSSSSAGTITPGAAATRPPANPLKNAYFGDLHLHTSYSFDAFSFGARTTPEDSYRYAMGETVDYFGKPQRRLAPLDFLAVTDHAELSVPKTPSNLKTQSLRAFMRP